MQRIDMIRVVRENLPVHLVGNLQITRLVMLKGNGDIWGNRVVWISIHRYFHPEGIKFYIEFG